MGENGATSTSLYSNPKLQISLCAKRIASIHTLHIL